MKPDEETTEREKRSQEACTKAGPINFNSNSFTKLLYLATQLGWGHTHRREGGREGIEREVCSLDRESVTPH